MLLPPPLPSFPFFFLPNGLTSHEKKAPLAPSLSLDGVDRLKSQWSPGLILVMLMTTPSPFSFGALREVLN